VPDPGQRIALGRTSVQVTRLGLGCAPLGNMFTALGEDQARATVDAAWELGIRWFDTAPLYGHGLSEQRLGAVLRMRTRADFALATKVGRLLVSGSDTASIFKDTPPLRPQFDFSYDGAMRSFEASLVRMGIDRVDVLHVHDPDEHEVEAVDGAFRALHRLREEGVIGAVGAGMNQSQMLTRFVEDWSIAFCLPDVTRSSINRGWRICCPRRSAPASR
jgi:D-threo-aldose 1-dehydrogenase